jgi:hypothetical protein
MSTMYKNESTAPKIEYNKPNTTEKKIEMLESKLNRLYDMVTALQADMMINKKAMRRQNTDIGNLGTALRSTINNNS